MLPLFLNMGSAILKSEHLVKFSTGYQLNFCLSWLRDKKEVFFFFRKKQKKKTNDVD